MLLAVDRVNVLDPLLVVVAGLLITGFGYVGRRLVVAAFRVVQSVNKIAAAVEQHTLDAGKLDRRVADLEDVSEEQRVQLAVVKEQLVGHERWHERLSTT